MRLAPRVVVVYRHTEWEEVRARHATRGQAAFFLARRGRTLQDVEARQAAQSAAMRAVTAAIPVEWRRGSIGALREGEWAALVAHGSAARCWVTTSAWSERCTGPAPTR